MQLYDKGIYYEPDCSDTELNHAMLVVGYGRDNTDSNGIHCYGDYWMVKNR